MSDGDIFFANRIEDMPNLNLIFRYSDAAMPTVSRDARAELAQLRDDSLLMIGSNRLLSEIGELLNCAPDAAILDSIATLRADLQAAQERIAERARQLDAARDVIQHLRPWRAKDIAADYASLVGGECGYTQSLSDYAKAAYAWLAANPAPSAEPQPTNGEGRP